MSTMIFGPDPRPEWLQRLTSGIWRGRAVELVYEGEKYALIKVPGHTYYVGRFIERGYAKTEYRIVKKENTSLLMNVVQTHEGRLSKADKARLIDNIKELDKP